jgi:DNA-binding response OmpR family regulator
LDLSNIFRRLPGNGVLSAGLRLRPDKDNSGGLPSQSEADAERNEVPRAACILLVEDNPADVLLVQESLDEHGIDCDLTVMNDGEKAFHFIDQIEAGKASCPALLVLDLNLPKRSGREVLSRLRASTVCAQVPVVILSSSDAPRDRKEAAQLGATLYIRKPSNLEDFMALGAILKRILSGTS